MSRLCRTIEEGASIILLQAGLPPEWWPLAVQYFCWARNVSQRKLKHHDAASAWEARHGEPFAGHEHPFGALVHFRPVKPRREALPTFAPNGQPGVFFGYHLNPGCRYSGDVICSELSDFNKQAATKPNSQAYIRTSPQAVCSQKDRHSQSEAIFQANPWKMMRLICSRPKIQEQLFCFPKGKGSMRIAKGLKIFRLKYGGSS